MTRPSPRSRRLAVLSAAVYLSGCGLFAKADPTVERDTPRDAPAAALLDAGAEPRRQLTFDLSTGTTVDLDLTLDLDITQRTADAEIAVVVDPPTTIQTVRLTVGPTDADGATVTFEIIDARLDPVGTTLTDAQIMELTAAVQRVIGLGGQLHIDRSGGTGAITYDPSHGLPADMADTLASLEQSLGTLVPVLPTEPVGRGARWRIVSRSDAGGLTVRQSTEYEITGIDGDRITYRATIGQNAPEQDIEGTDPPTRVLASDLFGTATGMVSTSDLATESETSLTGTQVIEQSAAPGSVDRAPQRVTQHLGLTITVGSTS